LRSSKFCYPEKALREDRGHDGNPVRLGTRQTDYVLLAKDRIDRALDADQGGKVALLPWCMA
jgi:hypothetical protein